MEDPLGPLGLPAALALDTIPRELITVISNFLGKEEKLKLKSLSHYFRNILDQLFTLRPLQIPKKDSLKLLRINALDLSLCSQQLNAKTIHNIPWNVEYLALTNCNNCILEILSLLSQSLKYLDLSGCINVQDNCIFGLPRSLKTLCLNRCKISDFGLHGLPPDLVKLELAGKIL